MVGRTAALFILLQFVFLDGVQCAISIYGGEDCTQCLLGTIDAASGVTYKGVCRSKFGYTTGYCCSDTEADSTQGRSFSCQGQPLCSWEIGP